MMTTTKAAAKIRMIPNRATGSVSLKSDNASATTVSCPDCWPKPLKSSASSYSGYQLSGQETLINVPQASLNPAANGRAIKEGDEITFAGVVYLVQRAELKSVLTRWECLVTRKL